MASFLFGRFSVSRCKASATPSFVPMVECLEERAVPSATNPTPRQSSGGDQRAQMSQMFNQPQQQQQRPPAYNPQPQFQTRPADLTARLERPIFAMPTATEVSLPPSQIRQAIGAEWVLVMTRSTEPFKGISDSVSLDSAESSDPFLDWTPTGRMRSEVSRVPGQLEGGSTRELFTRFDLLHPVDLSLFVQGGNAVQLHTPTEAQNTLPRADLLLKQPEAEATSPTPPLVPDTSAPSLLNPPKGQATVETVKPAIDNFVPGPGETPQIEHFLEGVESWWNNLHFLSSVDTTKVWMVTAAAALGIVLMHKREQKP